MASAHGAAPVEQPAVAAANAAAIPYHQRAVVQVINASDLLAHISSFMHFSRDPEDKAVDDGYRLALLPDRNMTQKHRAKTLGVVSEWSTEKMLAYLTRRTAYIQRKCNQRYASSEMPLDLPVIADQLVAWLEQRGADLKALRSHVQSVKLQEIIKLVETLRGVQSRWSGSAAAPKFTGVRDELVGIVQAVRNNIRVDSVQRWSAQFDSTSQALLEIIAARLAASADHSHAKEQEQLLAARAKIEQWRKTVAEYQVGDTHNDEDARHEFYQEIYGRIKSAKSWLDQPRDGSGMPYVQYFAD